MKRLKALEVSIKIWSIIRLYLFIISSSLDEKSSTNNKEQTIRAILIQNDEGMMSKVSTDSKKNENSDGQNAFTPSKNEDSEPKKMETSSLSIIDFSKDYKDLEGKIIEKKIIFLSNNIFSFLRQKFRNTRICATWN